MNVQSRYRITARISEYKVPPVDDVLVLGKSAPIGFTAMKRAIGLLIAQPYDHIKIDDEIIGDLLIRKNILRRLKKEAIINFIIMHIKPLMGENEILHLSLESETQIEVSEL
ncbi:hypothetical protein [Legionella impletisoli]|uniref:Uncharacterized protein n=1 Tax=Legionella impletisoli TaxID=343510 RepID=A0A917JQX7_9GAMM|nr:hypothetical protein [Legionella impletisoli]GGI81764.1 hypothetical protein GCM10007966_07880 [Legionella impletisoli]